MHEKILTIGFGSLLSFIFSAEITQKIMEMLILSFIGGLAYWLGTRCAKWICQKFNCWFKKKPKTEAEE